MARSIAQELRTRDFTTSQRVTEVQVWDALLGLVKEPDLVRELVAYALPAVLLVDVACPRCAARVARYPLPGPRQCGHGATPAQIREV
jgi:hypothetical protein